MDRILLAHGSGGGASHRLIQELFYKHLGNDILLQGNDAAVLPIDGYEPGARLAMSTDSFVVRPMFFRGGNIGKLAVCGTVNDLAVQGAKPLFLSLALIIEEGLSVEDLAKVVTSIGETARMAGVKIVTGDTKVVERGQADKLYINTTGVGLIPNGVFLGGERAKPGDAVLVSGTMGDHGMAIMSERAGISWETPIASDCAPLNTLIQRVLERVPGVNCFRDPTRGGLATTLNEIAGQAGVAIRLDEKSIPVSAAVQGACDMLGFDPLYVANEGKLIVIVPGDSAEAALAAMQEHPLGREAKIVGEVINGKPGLVTLRTPFGGERIIDMLEGEMLPRIC